MRSVRPTPSTQVEVVGAQEAQIHRALREGSFDLGLLTCLADDDMPPELETTLLLTGRVVVCMRPDSPLARLETIGVTDLLSVPMIVMRAGYLMHRLLHRLSVDRHRPCPTQRTGPRWAS